MAYATAADYEQYGNGSIPTEALDKELQLASDQVDSLTYNRIVGRGLAGLSTYQQTSVIKAVCQQADFSYQYGDFLTMPIAGYSAGSVSLSFKTVEGAGGVQTTEAVTNLLLSTGLTNRGLC